HLLRSLSSSAAIASLTLNGFADWVPLDEKSYDYVLKNSQLCNSSNAKSHSPHENVSPELDSCQNSILRALSDAIDPVLLDVVLDDLMEDLESGALEKLFPGPIINVDRGPGSDDERIVMTVVLTRKRYPFDENMGKIFIDVLNALVEDRRLEKYFDDHIYDSFFVLVVRLLNLIRDLVHLNDLYEGFDPAVLFSRTIGHMKDKYVENLTDLEKALIDIGFEKFEGIDDDAISSHKKAIPIHAATANSLEALQRWLNRISIVKRCKVPMDNFELSGRKAILKYLFDGLVSAAVEIRLSIGLEDEFRKHRISKTKKRIGKLINIHNDYTAKKDGPTKVEDLEAKWEKHIGKLKKNLAHMRKLRISFDFPIELLNSRLSTLNILQLEKASASVGVFDNRGSSSTSIITNDQASVISEQNIFATNYSKNEVRKKNDNKTIYRKVEIQEYIKSERLVKGQRLKFYTAMDQSVQDSGNSSGSHSSSNNQHSISINRPSGVVPTKRNNNIHEDIISLKRIKTSANDKPPNKMKSKQIVLAEDEGDDDNEMDANMKFADIVSEYRMTNSTDAEKVSDAEMQGGDSNPSTQNYLTTDIRKEMFSDSQFVQISPYEAEVQQVYEQLIKENEIEKMALLKIRDNMIEQAKNSVSKKEYPQSVEEIASLMAYLAKNDIIMNGEPTESEDNRAAVSTRFSLEDSQSSSRSIGGRESSVEKQLLQSFENYKSYNYKSGSGDVNETALDYSNPDKPRLAMAYIANVNPSYNMPGNLQFLDIAPGRAAYNLYGHHAPDALTKEELWTTVTDVKFSPDGKFIFSSSTDATIKLHSIRKDYNKFHMSSQDFKDENRKRCASDIIFNENNNTLIAGYNGFIDDPKGNWVACGTTGIGSELGDGSMWIWDIRSQCRTETKCEEKDANIISISPNDFYIALGGTSNSVYVFDTRQLNSILRVLRHDDPNDGLPHDGVMSLQWVPNSNILISGGNDNCVKVWNIGDKKENRMIYQFAKHDSPVTSVRLSPDFKVMTVGVSTGKIYVYSVNENFIEAGRNLKYF
ncbi:12626_t:CDS:10, partial [Acaulospora colombiana]